MSAVLPDGELSTRVRLRNWLGSMAHHLRRYGLWWAALVAAIIVFNMFFTLGFNVTKSLPGYVYLIKKWDRTATWNDTVPFRWHGGGTYDPYPAGLTFMKVVCGMPGDVVSTKGREFFINGESVGVAKEFSSVGHHRLEMGKTGVIPPGMFYACAPNPDSLDSRYALTGWIPLSAVEGKAIRLF
jgi:conjugal transfer pilin signal peptidase TrbI